MFKPLFITFEGIDGSGKSSVMKQLPVVIHNYETTCISTKEPLDGPFRNALLGDPEMPSKLQHLLIVGSRRENNEIAIKPALANNKHVFCDRYLLSTIVYQLTNKNDDDYPETLHVTPEEIERYHKEFNFVYPDVTFILDVDVGESNKRVNERLEDMNHFDKAESFLKGDRAEIFRELYKLSLDPLSTERKWTPTRLKIGNMLGKSDVYLIDANQPLDKVVKDICDVLSSNHGIKTIYS